MMENAWTNFQIYCSICYCSGGGGLQFYKTNTNDCKHNFEMSQIKVFVPINNINLQKYKYNVRVCKGIDIKTHVHNN